MEEEDLNDVIERRLYCFLSAYINTIVIKTCIIALWAYFFLFIALNESIHNVSWQML